MKNSIFLLLAIAFISLFLFSCTKENESYSYCVVCPKSVPGDTVLCFNSEAYARDFIETRSYLPDSNACKLISE